MRSMKKNPSGEHLRSGMSQSQQYKQDKETEEYPAGKGTEEMPTKPNERGRDREST